MSEVCPPMDAPLIQSSSHRITGTLILRVHYCGLAPLSETFIGTSKKASSSCCHRVIAHIGGMNTLFASAHLVRASRLLQRGDQKRLCVSDSDTSEFSSLSFLRRQTEPLAHTDLHILWKCLWTRTETILALTFKKNNPYLLGHQFCSWQSPSLNKRYYSARTPHVVFQS
ncbi:hypothetical protein Tco_0706022 [Tanacetum coccineum]|uniref:Uncharacterized protein n=1 Tax=Tanacetum coccineum TaxID=301880 RepID=A0ABQ4Y6B6_9ASTR